jgi:restriction endonuclease S subunit
MIAQKDDFPQVHISALASLPIPESDKNRHDQIVTLVEQILELHNQLPQAKTPYEKEAIRRQIATTDKQIDQLVYQLYGLTPEEIKIVEEAN